MSYAALPTTEESSLENEKEESLENSFSRAAHRQFPWRHALLPLALIIAVVITITGLWSLNLLNTSSDSSKAEPASSSKAISCGNTTAEAKAAGCHFDLMSFAWLPDACFDGELMDEFLAHPSGPWHWYSDTNKTTEISREEVNLGEYEELYVKWEYHLIHCTFMWKKMHRAVLQGRPIDDYIGSYGHTKHCEKGILDRTLALDDMNTGILLKFPGCPNA